MTSSGPCQPYLFCDLIAPVFIHIARLEAKKSKTNCTAEIPEMVLKAHTHQPDGEFNRTNEACVAGDTKLDLRKRKVRVLGFFLSTRKVSEREETQYLS